MHIRTWIIFVIGTAAVFVGAPIAPVFAATSQLTAVHVYTANTVWVKPANLNHIIVKVWGGGGGGFCGYVYGGGAGGGGGGYAVGTVNNVLLPDSVRVTVGSGGGKCRLYSNYYPDTSGGESSFGSIIGATGGAPADSFWGGIGGVGYGGHLNLSGSKAINNSSSLVYANECMHDGSCWTGSGPVGSPGGSAGTGHGIGGYFSGSPGQIPGGGGAGGGPLFDGGPGARGQVIVYEYENTVKVNGTCSPAHYTCTAGTSIQNVNGSASWTWKCTGANGGSAATCSETKSACTLPWGGTTPSGTSVTSYRTLSVTSPLTCSSAFQSKTRTCDNGTLSWGYTKGSCTVNHPPVIHFPSSNKTITLGQSVTYSSSATDADGNMNNLALNWRNPDGSYNWSRGQSSYQATVSSGPYFHYAPARSRGLYSISFTPTSLGTYKIYSVAHDPVGWVYSSSSSYLKVVPKPIATITVAPSTIYSGQSTQISWSSTNATSCVSTGGFSTGGRTAGSVSSGPLTTQTQYQVYCYGAGGSSARAYSDTQSVTVLVPAGTLIAYPSRVEEGTPTPIKFTWTLNNVKKGVNTCSINKRATGTSMHVPGRHIAGSYMSLPVTRGRISSEKTLPDTINTQTKYYIECNGKIASPPVIINVVPTFNNF